MLISLLGPEFSIRGFNCQCVFLMVTGPPRLIHFSGLCFYMNLFTFSHFSDCYALTHHRVCVFFSCCMCHTAGPHSTWFPPPSIPAHTTAMCVLLVFSEDQLPALRTSCCIDSLSLVPSSLA